MTYKLTCTRDALRNSYSSRTSCKAPFTFLPFEPKWDDSNNCSSNSQIQNAIKIRPSILEFLHVLRHINGMSDVNVSCAREGDKRNTGGREGGREERNNPNFISHLPTSTHNIKYYNYFITETHKHLHHSSYIWSLHCKSHFHPCPYISSLCTTPSDQDSVSACPYKAISIQTSWEESPPSGYVLPLTFITSVTKIGAYHNATRFAEIQTEND